jgi:hypothetical protein
MNKKSIQGIFVFLSFAFSIAANSATVRFDMEEEKIDFSFSAYIVLTGDSILEDATSYDFTDADSIEFWADIDQGWVQFEVTNPEQLSFASGPDDYYLSPFGSNIYLSETTTNNGSTTNWILRAIEEQIPGVSNDYGISLSALDGSQGYREDGLYSHPQWSVVPIPAAVWLFGSALAGLGWFRRKTA